MKEKLFQESISEFNKVFNFKDSNKFDDAQYKIFLCYINLGENDLAIKNLNKLREKYPSVIKEIRGRGLLIGIQLYTDQTKFIKKLMDNNLLTIRAAENVVRILPPLNVKKKEIDIDDFIHKKDEFLKDFDVSFQVDGGEVVTETYTGNVASEETVQHTFSTAVDMSTVGETYVVLAYTTLTDDENDANDGVTEDITHLNPNDIGVSGITSPSSGELLSNAESVTVTITNYGGATQYDFDVTYEFNGETVTETVAGPLEGNSSMEYTFTQTVDVSEFGTYTITVYTSLTADSDTSNDSISAEVTNINCAPSMDCSFADGFQLFQFGDINNESGCELSLIHI